LANLVSTANLANLVSTSYLQSQLGSTVIGLGTAGYLSSIVFGSIVSTANLANLVSTANLANHISTANLANLVSTANLANFVSTANLANLVSTANLANFVSTANLANHISTANLANLVSTTYLATQLASTVIGLGTAGYISSAQLLSTTNGYSLNFTTQNASISSLRFSTATANNAYISSLNIDQLTFGDGNGWADFGVLRALAISTLVVNTGILYATTVSTSQLIGVNFLVQSNLTSTVIGLGTVGYLSSVTAVNLANLVSTANLANLVSTANLANLVSTANLANLVSTANLANLVSTANLANFVSTANLANLVSTANLANLISTANLANFVSTTYLTTQLGSTVIGLGTAGYLSTIVFGSIISTANLANLVSTANLANLVSTANLANLVSTANLANLVSTANLANFVSTTYLATQLGSTVRGLGTAGYLSTINYSTVVLSSLTAQNLTSVQGYISSLTVDAFYLGSNSAFFNMGDVIATSLSTIQINVGTQFAVTISAQQLFVSSIQATNIIGALTTANLVNMVSTANLANHISTANLANLVSTANLANLVSTANLANLVSTANLANLVSTANLANLVSTTYIATQLGSTVIGLGTAGYISSSQLLSTSAGLSQYISSFIDPTELTSTVIGLGTQGFVSSLGLTFAVASTAQGLGTFGYTSTSQLLSTSLGLYQEIQNSPTNIKQSNVTSTIIGLGTFGYLSTVVFGSIISTANLANHVSTANLAGHISTANLANFVSTTYLSTQLGSTFATFTVSSLSTINIQATTAFISSLTTNSLTIGSNSGFINMGDVITTTLSSLQINTGIIYSTSNSSQQVFLSSINGIAFANIGGSNLVSTANLANFVSTANLANLVSTANLANLVSTANLANLVSTANLANHISTANLAGHISTANLANHISTANLAGHISTANLANFVSTTYLSTQLGSTFATLTVSSLSTFSLQGTTAFISSLTVNGLFIGSNQGFVNMGDVIATSVSSLVVYAGGMFSTSNSTQQTFLSSINGVAFANIGSGGIAGIPSSLNTSSISTFSFTGTTAFISSLTVNALFIGSNQGFVNMGDVIATSLSSLVIYTGSAFATSNQASITSTQQLNISSINGQTFGGPIISTVIGLGTAGYLSTIVFGSIISTANLANLVSTANLANLVSTANLVNLISTANLANLVSTANLANHISTANLANLVSTANLVNHISTANLANFVSTTYLSTQLGSTFAVLNVSSFSTFSFTGITGFMSTLTVNNLFIGSNQGFTTMGDVIGTSLSTILLYTGVEYATNIYASSLVVSSILAYSNQGIIMSTLQLNISSINGQLFGAAPSIGGVISTANLANLVSTANLANHISTANLANLVSTANLANLVSTANLANHISTANLANLVSTANLANIVSTSFLATQLSSTIRGITSTFVISSLLAQNINSVQGYVSSLVVDSLQLGSNTAYIYMGDVIATSLSTVFVATGSLTTPRISAQQLFVSSIAINCNAPLYAMDINANFRVNSNSFFTGGVTSFMSNSGLFSNVATATFVSNVLHTGGLTSFMSNSGLFSNAGAATFNSNITIQQNITSIATPSTANSYSLLTLNIPTAGSATTLAPIISLVGGYGASIAGGLTQSVGPVLSLGTIAGSGQPTIEGYRMTGTNSVFYGNVTVGTPGSNNTITIQTGGTITVPTGAGGLGNAAYLLLNTPNNTVYLGGDYVFLQPAGNISFYRDFYTSWPATFYSTINTTRVTTTFNGSPGTFLLANNASSSNYVIKCEMTGANFQVRQAVNAGSAAVIENTGGGALLINPLGASVSIGSSNNSYMLDVAGIARSGIPVSSLTGTSATFGANAFGIYYYITNSAFSNIGLYNTSGGATGTGGTAPLIGTGWYVTLRNNTGSYLSITVNGLLASTPASPFTIPPANSVTIAYDANLAGGAGYVFF
jgi:hypothetical protein